jgi:DNA-directed RNA polymerase specialized sigma subunit
MDARRIPRHSFDELEQFSQDILYETKCRHRQAWLINDEYLKQLHGLDDVHMEHIQIAKLLMDTDFPGLTKRQKQVMKYFITGHTQNKIAETLKITQQAASQAFNAGLKKIKKNFHKLKEK